MSVEIIGVDIVQSYDQAKQLFVDQNFRTVAGDILTLMKKRVHKDGLNSAGTPFSQYSSGYLRIRACNKRGTSTKKIMSLTRELENSYGLIRITDGWAIGIISGGGTGGQVGFSVSCVKKTSASGKTTYKRKRVDRPANKPRKTISNAQKIKYLEMAEGPFMSKLSQGEVEYFNAQIQAAWTASMQNTTI